jgi:peptidoglycan/LPS O-acetylase OafA/YrhL
LQPKYRYFGAFRLLLALMVVVQHAMPGYGPPELRAALAPLEIGSGAVLLFFVLSGFIVVEAAMLFYEGRAGAFLTNRLIRIYPPYIVAVLLTLLVTIAVGQLGGDGAILGLLGAWPDHSASNVLASLIGILPIAGKLVAPLGAEPILTLAWALRIELMFYGVVFLALLAGRMLGQPSARLLGLAGISLLAVNAVWFDAMRGHGLEYVPYFVLGASVYFAITPASTRRRVLASALVLITCVMIAIHISGQEPENLKAHYQRNITGQIILFYAGLAVWCALIALPRLQPALGQRWYAMDQAAGELTYSVYLTHVAALLPCLWLVPTGGFPALLLALVACLGTAYAMNHLVERRLLAMRKKVRGQEVNTSNLAAVAI